MGGGEGVREMEGDGKECERERVCKVIFALQVKLLSFFLSFFLS